EAPPTSEEIALEAGAGLTAADGMPRWLWRAVLLVIGMVAASYAALTFVRQVRSLIVWLISALFLSFALEPAVNWLGRHGWKRGLATFAVLLGLGVLVVVMIALFTFYFVADGPRMRRAICSLLPPKRQREVLFTWEVAIEKTGGYLYSRLLLGSISAVCFFIVLKIIGVPFAVPLAIWMGVVS